MDLTRFGTSARMCGIHGKSRGMICSALYYLILAPFHRVWLQGRHGNHVRFPAQCQWFRRWEREISGGDVFEILLALSNDKSKSKHGETQKRR
ncbi:hypothetical protein BDN67DRAFT_227686 [Paxillus ammoniavirescens]|nr:hypothetical protein BDN67DRAFT_227686 [Paxillus ammoniavirescens]